MIAIITWFILSSGVAFSHEKNTGAYTLRQERTDQVGFRHQQAVIWKNKAKLKISRNSNEACEVTDSAWLGLLQAKEPNENWNRSYTVIEQIGLRTLRRKEQKHSSTSFSRDAHTQRVYLGTRLIHESDPYFQATKSVLEQGCNIDLREWIPEKAVEVKIVQKEDQSLVLRILDLVKKSTSELSLAKAKCRDQNGIMRCSIPDYGRVFLKSPASQSK